MASKAQGPDLDAIPPDAVLPLQDWLKLLASRGVPMRVAMALAAKIYNSHNTKTRLSELDTKKLTPLIPDKESRRSVQQAMKGIASGEAKTKKRGRDSDMLEPLKTNQGDDDVPLSLDFKEELDPEKLIPLTVTTNRAPVKTAWAYTVAQRLGFDVQESLSIAHGYVHISSLKHAIMLGNILNPKETKEGLEEIRELPGMASWGVKGKERETTWDRRGRERAEKERKERDENGSSQPWVGILKQKPVIERTDGTWRAIEKGIAIPPSTAFRYISRAFKDNVPNVMGAMKLVAASHPPEDLNRLGMHMYNEFKPEVEQWGQKGTLELAKILDCAKGPVDLSVDQVPAEVEEMARLEEGGERPGPSRQGSSSKPIMSGASAPEGGEGEEGDDDDGSELSEPPPVLEHEVEDSPAKKKVKKDMSVEEYEALLDAEGEGGYMEAGDLYGGRGHRTEGGDIHAGYITGRGCNVRNEPRLTFNTPHRPPRGIGLMRERRAAVQDDPEVVGGSEMHVFGS